MNTDRLRGYAYGVRDPYVPDDHPRRRVLPVDRFVELAVRDMREAAREIDRLRETLARVCPHYDMGPTDDASVWRCPDCGDEKPTTGAFVLGLKSIRAHRERVLSEMGDA